MFVNDVCATGCHVLCEWQLRVVSGGVSILFANGSSDQILFGWLSSIDYICLCSDKYWRYHDAYDVLFATDILFLSCFYTLFLRLSESMLSIQQLHEVALIFS